MAWLPINNAIARNGPSIVHTKAHMDSGFRKTISSSQPHDSQHCHNMVENLQAIDSVTFLTGVKNATRELIERYLIANNIYPHAIKDINLVAALTATDPLSNVPEFMIISSRISEEIKIIENGHRLTSKKKCEISMLIAELRYLIPLQPSRLEVLKTDLEQRRKLSIRNNAIAFFILLFVFFPLSPWPLLNIYTSIKRRDAAYRYEAEILMRDIHRI